jgi:hypothetical protein
VVWHAVVSLACVGSGGGIYWSCEDSKNKEVSYGVPLELGDARTWRLAWCGDERGEW